MIPAASNRRMLGSRSHQEMSWAPIPAMRIRPREIISLSAIARRVGAQSDVELCKAIMSRRYERNIEVRRFLLTHPSEGF